MAEAPLLLINNGDDADFFYATRFLTHDPALYLRFGSGDDVLVLSVLELERGRKSSSAARVVDRAELGWDTQADDYRAWGRLAARLLAERGTDRVRVSPLLPSGYLEELRAADVAVEVERDLFVADRRRKRPEEAEAIHAAQRAAEAAISDIVAVLAVAEVRDGVLWHQDRPLTSERLMAAGQSTLNELGYSCEDMIVAGSPECWMPHFRGEGPIKAGAPVIIDIFPRGRASRYHGDLTRTVVPGGEVAPEYRRAHAAVVAALDAAIAAIRPGVTGRRVHEAACRVLLEHGYGTSTPGLEGPEGEPRMIHSTGHGVGLAVHELPQLRPADVELVEGDVVTVEPGVYLEGWGGIRVEDTGIVTAEGFRNFTSISRSLRPQAYL